MPSRLPGVLPYQHKLKKKNVDQTNIFDSASLKLEVKFKEH